MRNTRWIAVFALPTLAIVGCGGSTDDAGGGSAAPPTATSTPATTEVGPSTVVATTSTTTSPPVPTYGPIGCQEGSPGPWEVPIAGPPLDGTSMALLLDGQGRGDGGWNDAAGEAADQAVEALGMQLTEYAPGDGENRAATMAAAIADGNTVVIAVGAGWTDLVATAAAGNPNVSFLLLGGEAVHDNGTPGDSSDDVALPNVRNAVLANNEGAFLMGVAAACASPTGHVGFIGGVTIPVVIEFEVGFTAGVRAVRPDAVVDAVYLSRPPDFSGFNDPLHANAVATRMIADGADVIFPAVGASASGVLDAVRAAGAAVGDLFMIGVDRDEYLLAEAALQPYILTSLLQRLDVAVADFVNALAARTPIGGTVTYGAHDGFFYSTANTEILHYAGTIEAWLEKVMSGEVVVPEHP